MPTTAQRDKLIEELAEKGRVSNYETTLLRKDGSEIHVLASVQHVYGAKGTPAAIEGTFVDITQRKAMERSLIESEKRLTIILEKAPVGILIIDTATQTIVYANQYVEDVLKLKRKQFIGKQCRGFICPECTEKCPLIGHGRELSGMECEILKKDGKPLPVLKTAVAIQLEGKNHLVEIFIDISERKKTRDRPYSGTQT